MLLGQTGPVECQPAVAQLIESLDARGYLGWELFKEPLFVTFAVTPYLNC